MSSRATLHADRRQVDALPARIGRYTLMKRLGAGGCGAVFQARDEAAGGDVAIKVSTTGSDTDPATSRRSLIEEGRILRRVACQHVVGFLDEGVVGDRAYLVMGLATGGALSQRIKSGLVGDPWTTARVGAALAAALSTVHRAGIVHRDVAPSNILVCAQHLAPNDRHHTLLEQGDRVVLADFGIAAAAGDRTPPGQGKGKPLFHAPELDDHRAGIGPAADIYSATATIVTVISGRMPPAVDRLDPLLSILRPRWRRFVATGMHPDGRKRHPSMGQWYEGLHDAIDHDLRQAGRDGLDALR